MIHYKVIYKLTIGTQEMDLSVFVKSELGSHIDDIIDKANTILNENLHIPIDILNDADIEIHPAPSK